MKDTNTKKQPDPDDTKVLGDINPIRREHSSGPASDRRDRAHDFERRSGDGEPDENDVQPDRPGSRDVTEGVTGGTSVGGTRNFRTGSGVSGGDIGNRPE